MIQSQTYKGIFFTVSRVLYMAIHEEAYQRLCDIFEDLGLEFHEYESDQMLEISYVDFMKFYQDQSYWKSDPPDRALQKRLHLLQLDLRECLSIIEIQQPDILQFGRV